MRHARIAFAGLVLAALLSAAPAAAATKTYQVTGPVLEVNDTMIAVQKGKDRWEIARDASTKVTGDLKVGAKVTIEYRMTATAVDVKADKAAAKKK
jgi:phosphate-selective porin